MKTITYRVAQASFISLLVLLILYPFCQIVRYVFLFLLGSHTEALSLIKEKLLLMLRFSLTSSSLSALLSVILAILNLALLKKSHVLIQKTILALLFVPFGIAPIVGTLSLLVFFGKKGQLLWILSSLGFDQLWNSKELYSYAMINFLNLLYNVPLLSLFFWNLSLYFPSPLLNKARLLGASSFKQIYSILYPLFSPHILAGFCLVFVYTYQSFFPILFLGNKLGYLSSEILIYEQLTWNFCLKNASFIAFLQIILLSTVLALFLFNKPRYSPFHLKENLEKKRKPHLLASLASSCISGFSCLLWLPLLIRSANLGLGRFLKSIYPSIQAIKNSLIIAGSTSFLVITLSLFLLFNYPRFFYRRKSFYFLFLPFTLSPLLTSYFYQNLLGDFIPNKQAFWVIISTQVVTQLPLALYFLSRNTVHFKTLPIRAKTLGAKGILRWLSLDLPLFKSSYLYVFFVNLITSLGHLSVSMLYLSGNFQTLPLRINQLLNFYRFDEAINVASLSLILFFILLGVYTWIHKRLESLR